jgi:hypothetical protein
MAPESRTEQTPPETVQRVAQAWVDEARSRFLIALGLALILCSGGFFSSGVNESVSVLCVGGSTLAFLVALRYAVAFKTRRRGCSLYFRRRKLIRERPDLLEQVRDDE